MLTNERYLNTGFTSPAAEREAVGASLRRKFAAIHPAPATVSTGTQLVPSTVCGEPVMVTLVLCPRQWVIVPLGAVRNRRQSPGVLILAVSPEATGPATVGTSGCFASAVDSPNL